MAAQYLIVRNVVCHSTGLVYVRQHLDRMLEAEASWTTDEDDLFTSMKSRRYRGVRREPSLCLSQYGSAELLSEYQKLSLNLNTGLPASAACERLFSCAGLLFNVKLES